MISLRLAAFIIFLCTILSCQSTGERKFKIGFSQPIMGDEWRETMYNEMQRQLLFHEDMELILKDAGGTTSNQIIQIQDLVSEGIDLLIVSPNEAEPITPIIESVYDRGIPVVVLDRKIYSKKYTAYVGADNLAIGENVAKYLAGLLNGAGRVLELVESQSVTAFEERHKGFQIQISNYPGITVDQAPALARGISRYKELISSEAYDAIFAPTDVAAYYAYQVADSSGIQTDTYFIGIDGLPGKGGGLDLVDRGILTASFLYPTGGDVAIEVAASILRGDSVNKENLLMSTVIDKNNLLVMQLQAEKLHSQQTDIQNLANKLTIITDVFQTQRTLTYLFAITMVISVIASTYAFKSLVDKQRINKELKFKNDQITEFAKKAEEATRAKFRFFTNISHEFKTPLTLINAPLDELLSNKQTAPFANDLKLIRKNAHRLLLLVNQLMDFRKIDNSKMILNASCNNLVIFLRDIISSFDKLAKSRNIRLKLITDEQDIELWFDQGMMDKVFFNLLSNAFKFTYNGGNITIKVSKDPAGKYVNIEIADSGMGMSGEDMKHLFDRFHQGEKSGAFGTGLGLALTKEIVELHHGKIEVSSEPDKGTKFRIQLNAGKEHFSPEEIRINPKDHIPPETLGYVDDEIIFTANKSQNQGQSVLVVEDNVELRAFLVSRLAKEYEVFEAGTVEDGLDQAYNRVPDLIICDLGLEGESGFEVIQRLKSDIRSSHIPVIILSARNTMEDQLRGIRLGADDYITKPFNLSLLLERIKALLIKTKKLREHYLHELPGEHNKVSSAKIDKKFVNTFTSIVEEHLSDPNFGVNEISEAMGLSRVQLYRKVKAILGYGVNDYVVSVRMQKAKHLLLEGKYTVAEIAYQVGFSTPAYFSTAFKNQFGVSPKDFIASHKS